MRRAPDLRPDLLLRLALDEIERLKGTKTRTTDGRNVVITTPGSAPPGGGSTVPAPVEAGPHVIFGSKHTHALRVTVVSTPGLDIAYDGGQFWMSGTFHFIDGGTLTLTDDVVNYVFIDNTGTVTFNTTAFPSDSIPLAVLEAISGSLTSNDDQRAYLSPGLGFVASHAHTINETPTGSVGGGNAVFVLGAIPVTGTEQIWKNGLLMRPGSGNDYTIAGATFTFEADQIPSTGDILLASYMT